MAAAIGRDIEAIYQGNNRGVLADVDLLQRITEACRACVREFVRERTSMDGRIGANFLPSLLKWTGFYQEPLTRALQVRPLARLPAVLVFCATGLAGSVAKTGVA
jgi:magnesium chelatase subunit H